MASTVPFGRRASVKIGTIQRRLAWPLRKDDTHKSRSIALFGGNTISARDLRDDDGPSNALEAIKALHHPERKAAEKLLLTNGLRETEQRKMRQYGHLVNESVGFMAVPFSAFGSTAPRVAKLLKGVAKRQKQDEVWDSLGRTTNLNPMTACLQFSYAFSPVCSLPRQNHTLGPR